MIWRLSQIVLVVGILFFTSILMRNAELSEQIKFVSIAMLIVCTVAITEIQRIIRSNKRKKNHYRDGLKQLEEEQPQGFYFPDPPAPAPLSAIQEAQAAHKQATDLLGMLHGKIARRLVSYEAGGFIRKTKLAVNGDPVFVRKEPPPNSMSVIYDDLGIFNQERIRLGLLLHEVSVPLTGGERTRLEQLTGPFVDRSQDIPSS